MLFSKILIASLLLFGTGMGTLEFIESEEQQHASFVGTYTGMFSGSPIEIRLEKVADGKASGYNVHKKLKRPISGYYMPVPNASFYKFVLQEPGDNEYDGSFELLIDSVQLNGEGTWVPKTGSKLKPVPFDFMRKK
ncbi:MAG TPA: hypothetical protein VLC98_13595 [Phnomibacter sp.]|nr:hypothetical protein [Phnomibacter sp.]